MARSTRSRAAPMRCRQVRRLMQSFLDGELPPSQTELVAAHLEDCERCGLGADTYRRVKASLAALRGDPAPGALDRLRTFADGIVDE